jgi:hypothetical protein
MDKFKQHFLKMYEEAEAPASPKGKAALLRELENLMDRARKEEGDMENQNIIFKKVILVGIRKDPKNFLEKAEATISKYPQFRITKNNVHWTECLIVDDIVDNGVN